MCGTSGCWALSAGSAACSSRMSSNACAIAFAARDGPNQPTHAMTEHKRALGFRLISGCDDVSDGGNLSLGIGKAGENRLLEKKKGRCSTDP